MLNLTSEVGSFSKSNNFQDKAAATVLTIAGVSVWFSYLTPIAFQMGDNPLVVRKHGGSNILARHLNELDGGTKESRKARIDGKKFNALYRKQLGAFGTQQVRRAA